MVVFDVAEPGFYKPIFIPREVCSPLFRGIVPRHPRVITAPQEELQALTLGAQWVGRQTDDGLALAAQNAIAKIGAVLPSELRHLLTDNAFHVGRGTSAPASIDLQVLRHAMREQFKLHIAYSDPKGDETQRIIWPIMLGFIDTKRFVAGWCELRQDFRTFRTDRIGRVKLLEERYPGRMRGLAKRWRTLADAERATATARSSAAKGS
ncbi:helix-turn-helix transcriptional regulator [Tardiphaga sp. 367_B4_N1_1]|uniref:helix-turn-helix transcriptional regulator n=1 Tax=Tardiphaga sp. 367_B4_N1_1 TaxID=3240777 RepID=UPI003F223301